MDPLSTLTLGVLLKECANTLITSHVIPVLNALIAGKVKDKMFPSGIQQKVKIHLDEAFDIVFPYQDSYSEHYYEQVRKSVWTNLKAYLSEDDSLVLTLEQQQILEEWVRRMLNDPICFQVLEANNNEVRFNTLMQMLGILPDRVSEATAKLLEKKDKIDDARHIETIKRIEHLEEVVQADAKTESKANEDELIEQINNKFIEMRDNHPSMQLMKISDQLFPDGVATRMSIKAKDEWSGKSRSMGTILEDSWKREKNHIMIVGEGGIGKTVTLLSIPNWFESIHIPAIYIPLYELKSDEEDPIAEYITRRILNRIPKKLDALFSFLDESWNGRPRLLLLVDGFNEIPVDARITIGRNIDDWAELSGIQIITSSRFDTSTYFFNRNKYYKVELQPLSKDSVVQYMTQADMTYPDDPAIARLISTPLMLNLFMETRIVIDRRKQNKEEDSLLFREENTAGSIIWNYLQCEVWNAVTKSGNDDTKVNACIVATEFIAPYMAGKMYDSGAFSLSDDDFDASLEEAISILKKAGNGLLLKRIRNSWQKTSYLETDMNKYLKELLTKELHILVNRDCRFKFMHQNFRDALAAIHLVNASYLVDENTLPKEWQTPIDYYVMNYIAELATEEDADRLWKQNRMAKAGKEAIINMIELQKRKRAYDFSELDFSGLDLSDISLFPYRVPGTSTLLLPHNPVLNKDLHVSSKTFYSEGHASKISVLVASPDGKRCVSGSSDKTLRVWDIETGECLKVLKGHKGSILTLSLTPDGKHCVSGSGDNTLRVWSIETGECLRVLRGHNGGIFALSLTPNGKHCISGSSDKTLRVWNIETGECLKVLKGHDGGIFALSLTPEGKYCISGSKDTTLRIWNIDTGECLKVLKGHTKKIRCLSLSPNGKRCVSGSADNALRVWDIENGECLRVLNEHTGDINNISITPDGKRCVSGSEDKTLRVWDIETGECLRVLKGHESGILTLSLSSDGKRCISGSGDRTLRVWDIETGERSRILKGHESGIITLSLSPNGKRCVSGSFEGTLRVWDIETDVCLRVMERPRGGILALSLTPDGKRFVSGSYDGTLRVWDSETDVCLRVMEGHKGSIITLSLTSDGKRCVSGSDDKTLRIWDVETGVCLKTLVGHTDGITSLSLTPDGTRCISGSKDSTLRVWDIETYVCQRVIAAPESGIITLSLTSDGKRCVSVSNNGTLRVWDIETGMCLRVMAGHSTGSTPPSITPDGKRCICACGKTLRLLNIETGKCLRILKGHEGRIFTFSLTPDGKHCISGSKDCTLRVWNIKSGECLKVLKKRVCRILALTLSPDGKRCVCGCSDSSLSLWDIENGKCLRVMNVHKGGILALSITPDGKRCISGNHESVLHIWDIKANIHKTNLGATTDGTSTGQVSFDAMRSRYSIGDNQDMIDMEVSSHFTDSIIEILPLILKDINLAQAIVPKDLKETLRQNGALFDDNLEHGKSE